MRNRELLYKFNILIKIFVFIISLSPDFLLNFLWVITDNGRGKFVLLLRYSILKKWLAECGENIYIGPNVEIRAHKNMKFGSNISINRGCYIDGSGGLTIQDNVSIAHHCSILTTNHTWEDNNLPIKDQAIVKLPVIIKENVWIGCGSRLINGITINNKAIIAAGAVVNKDVPSNSIVGGVPAKVIKSI